jgi:hypothetical protein
LPGQAGKHWEHIWFGKYQEKQLILLMVFAHIGFICFMFYRTHIIRTWCSRFDSSFTQYSVKIRRSAKLNYQKSKDGFTVSFYLVSEG